MKACAIRSASLLRECRAVSIEVGSFSEAWALPSEIRGWWISEMLKERESENSPATPSDGRRIIRTDVPRANRESHEAY